MLRQFRSQPNSAPVHVAIDLAVRDSGEGLDTKDAARIFDPFFTTKPDGMALGLSISRRIIEEHGGALWATANEDKGLPFSLPCQRVSESE